MNTEQYKIIHLPKEKWKRVTILMRYTTEEYDFPDSCIRNIGKRHWTWVNGACKAAGLLKSTDVQLFWKHRGT